MSREQIIIRGTHDRVKAEQIIAQAPTGTRIEFRPPRRSLPQNDVMWGYLRDVAKQVEWYGSYLSPEDWKNVCTASLRQSRVVPGIEPGTYVPLGLHTSDMDKEEMSNLIELILAFGSEHGVVFTDHIHGEGEGNEG